MTTMGQGVLDARQVDVGSEEYHQITAVSCSMLKSFAKDPETCWEQNVARIAERKMTKAFEFGIRLERAVFFNELPNAVVVPTEVCSQRKKPNSDEYTFARAGAAFMEWKERTVAEKGPDVLMLTQTEFDAQISPLLIAIERLKEHEAAAKLLWGDAEPHVTYLWDDVSRGFTLPCKCQLDLRHKRGVLVDLKSATPSNCETKADFARHCWEFGYHWQSWWYRHAHMAVTGQSLPFAFVVAQSEAPHRVFVYELDPEWDALAEYQIRQTFSDLAECWRSGVWRAKDFGKIVKLKPPRWAAASVEDGE